SVAVGHDKKQPNNPRFVSGSEDKTVAVWRRFQAGPPDLLWHAAPVRVVACSPPAAEKSLCLVGCAHGTVYVWDLDNLYDEKRQPRPVHVLEGKHADGVSALAFSPDGAWFASGGQDNSILLWDTKEGTVKYPFDPEHGVDSPHQGTVTALYFT